MTPSVEVYDVDEASDESIRLVWRVAQEAVRNAIRHSNAEHLTVQVRTIDDVLHLDVSDDGDGFDSEEVMAGRDGRARRQVRASATAEVAAGVGAGVGRDRRRRRPRQRPRQRARPASGCAASAT